MKEKTLMYQFEIMHVPGKANAGPDAASRYPARVDSGIASERIVCEEASRAYAVVQGDSICSVSWENISDAAAADEEYVMLKGWINEGFPDSRCELPKGIRAFWPMRNELYSIENVIFRDGRILIP